MRKLSHDSTINKINCTENFEDISADILRQELSTKEDALSFWKCDSLEDKKDTIKTILLSNTGIEKSVFLLFPDDIVNRYGINIDDKEIGRTGYKNHATWHINFSQLTYRKIGDILAIIKEVIQDESLIIRLNRNDVKEYIKEVINNNLLDKENIHSDLMKDLKKYELIH